VLPRTLGSIAKGPDDVASFEVQPAHFVERHGLMLIIVLGESVLAMGVGLGSGAGGIDGTQVGFAALSLTLAASLYWAYFGSGEDQATERALTEGRSRPIGWRSTRSATRSRSSCWASSSSRPDCTTRWQTRSTTLT
jgi:low temperature requirement protein LtrA